MARRLWLTFVFGWIGFVLVPMTAAQSATCDDVLLLPGADEDGTMVLYWYDVGGNTATAAVRFPLLSGRSQSISEIVWSPDRSRLAYVHEQRVTEVGHTGGASDLYVLDCLDSTPFLLGTQGVSRVRWSPDGKQLAFLHYSYSRVQGELVAHSAIKTVNVDGSGEQTVFEAEESLAVVAWTTRGILLLGDGNLYRLEDGVRTTWFGGDDFSIAYAAVSPNETQAALHINVGDLSGYTALLDLTTLELTRLVDYGSGIPGQLLWSPDGNRLVFSFLDERDQYRLYLWEAGLLSEISDPRPWDIYLREWMPDGAALLGYVGGSPLLSRIHLSGEVEEFPFQPGF